MTQQNNFLYERKNTTPTLDWPTITFDAIANGEESQEVNIMTLTSYYEMLCYEKAADAIRHKCILNEHDWYETVQSESATIMNTGNITVREMVLINNNASGLIIIDVDKITDEAVDTALSLLEQSEIPGTTYFGEPTTFTAEQISLRKESYNGNTKDKKR